MATIYLDSLVKPKLLNSPQALPELEGVKEDFTYIDLHLDLEYSRPSVLFADNGDRVSRDLRVDYDVNAIRNSIYNIFTTSPGNKILNPLFGCRLEDYLFEAITVTNAQTLGNKILAAISTFEPRVEVLKVQVTPEPDLNTYKVNLIYKILDKGLLDNYQIELNSQSKSLGYRTVSYEQ
jgi:phage baseplate assembly protein W